MMTFYALITGYLFDIMFGDPQRFPHPVRWIGSAIAGGEKLLRRTGCRTKRGEYACGLVLTVFVAGLSFTIPFLLLHWLRIVNPWLGFAAEAFMCYQILATKSLRDESMKVYNELRKNNIPGARKNLSRIVGRDTGRLNRAQIAGGAVETVAENLSDGVVAPMLYMLIGGAPLGFLYKAVNTLDSMIGYKNDRYLYFGRFAARLDDIANYLPARISAYLMILAVFFCGYDVKGALRIYRRDRHNHTSPNSAQTEAVCAGALNIQVAGNNYYSGRLVVKPTIGDAARGIEAEDIRRANRIMYITSLLGLILGSGARLAIIKITEFL